MRQPEQGGRPVIFGTAGHIDHGKTTLTRALTGQDTDRLPEEKARGISIDLGFAHFVLPSGQPAALIDVPGHERFIRNMVAGVHGMDAVMLVIAADEGIMPQTREHLDILSLLGVERGLTVITKADLVEGDMIDLVRELVVETFVGTFLADAPVVVVDAVTGRGLDDLRAQLMHLAAEVRERPVEGPVRLPIDRVFSVKGFGTVVTGTQVSGTLHLDQQVELVPAGLPVRVRGLEVHGNRVTAAGAGQRVAVNVTGADKAAFTRGSVLAAPGTVRGVDVLVAAVTMLSSGQPLKMNDRVHCHAGTAEAVGRVYLYDREEILPGETAFGEIRLETPMAVVRNDRCLLRSYSPVMTIGGGVVLEAGKRHRRREPGLIAHLTRLATGTDRDIVLTLLASRGQPVSLPWLVEETGMAADRIQAILTGESGVIHDQDRFWWTETEWRTFAERVRARLGAHHRDHPLQVGIVRERLRQDVAPGWPPRALIWAVERIEGVELDREWVRLSGFSPMPTGDLADWVDLVYGAVDAGGLRPDDVESVAGRLPVARDMFYDVLEYLVLAERLVRLEEGVYISDRAFANGVDRVRAVLGERGSASTADLREALATNRRFAVLFLELLDGRHITRRVGETRILVG